MHGGQVKVQSKRSERQCPLCWEPARLLGNVSCPACRTRYHRECADELGGRCATLACPGLLPTSPPPGDYLERFQGLPRRGRRRPPRLGRRWSSGATEQAVCGLNALFVFALVGYGVSLGLLGAEKAQLTLCLLSALILVFGAVWERVGRRR